MSSTIKLMLWLVNTKIIKSVKGRTFHTRSHSILNVDWFEEQLAGTGKERANFFQPKERRHTNVHGERHAGDERQFAGERGETLVVQAKREVRNHDKSGDHAKAGDRNNLEHTAPKRAVEKFWIADDHDNGEDRHFRHRHNRLRNRQPTHVVRRRPRQQIDEQHVEQNGEDRDEQRRFGVLVRVKPARNDGVERAEENRQRQVAKDGRDHLRIVRINKVREVAAGKETDHHNRRGEPNHHAQDLQEIFAEEIRPVLRQAVIQLRKSRRADGRADEQRRRRAQNISVVVVADGAKAQARGKVRLHNAFDLVDALVDGTRRQLAQDLAKVAVLPHNLRVPFKVRANQPKAHHHELQHAANHCADAQANQPDVVPEHENAYDNRQVIKQRRQRVKEEPAERLLRASEHARDGKQQRVERQATHNEHSVVQLRRRQVRRHDVVHQRLSKDQDHDGHHGHYDGEQVQQARRKLPNTLLVTAVQMLGQHRHKGHAQCPSRKRKEEEIRNVKRRKVGIGAVRPERAKVGVHQLGAQETEQRAQK